MNIQPQISPCYITSLCTAKKHSDKYILQVVQQLIEQSASAGLAISPLSEPINMIPITHIRDIQVIQNTKSWPYNWHKNCMVLGSLKKPFQKIDVDFLYDCNPENTYGYGDYDEHCQRILSYYDWAFFSYFTTYGGNVLSFITSDKNLHHDVNNCPKLDIIERYDSPDLGMAQLRYAVFYDYDAEWLLPLALAKTRNEDLPLLLHAIDASSFDCLIYDHVTDENIEGQFGYTKHLEKLKLLDSWEIRPQNSYSNSLWFQVFEITDVEAYNKLHMSGIDCVLSADCDLVLLKQYTQEQYQYRDLGHFIKDKQLASWGYDCFYGGGSDEHMGIFYAQDGRITEKFWQLLGQNAQRDTQLAIHSTVFQCDKSPWMLPLAFNENTQQPLKVLCQFGPKDWYRVWSDEEFEYIDGTVWYEEYLSQLSLLSSFTVGDMLYQVYAVNDQEAYEAICQPSIVHPIVQAVFAHDCDFGVLQDILSQASLYRIEIEDVEGVNQVPLYNAENLNPVASWVLSKYDDRCSCYFYAKEKPMTQQFDALLDKLESKNHHVRVSRF